MCVSIANNNDDDDDICDNDNKQADCTPAGQSTCYSPSNHYTCRPIAVTARACRQARLQLLAL